MPVSYSSRHPGPAARFLPMRAEEKMGAAPRVLRDAGDIPTHGPQMAEFVERFCAEHGIAIRPFMRMAGLCESSIHDWRTRSTGANGGLRAVTLGKIRTALAEVRRGNFQSGREVTKPAGMEAEGRTSAQARRLARSVTA